MLLHRMLFVRGRENNTTSKCNINFEDVQVICGENIHRSKQKQFFNDKHPNDDDNNRNYSHNKDEDDDGDKMDEKKKIWNLITQAKIFFVYERHMSNNCFFI